MLLPFAPGFVQPDTFRIPRGYSFLFKPPLLFSLEYFPLKIGMLSFLPQPDRGVRRFLPF